MPTQLRLKALPAKFGFLAFIASFLLCVQDLHAADASTNVDLSALIHDTQYTKLDNQRVSIVWWIPEDYWKISFASSGAVTSERSEKILAPLRQYIMLGLVQGTMGVYGTTTFDRESAIRSRLTLTDRDGNQYKPISTNDYSDEITGFISLIKPVLAQSMGKMGQNFQFYLFDAKSKDGVAIADVMHDGKFSVTIGDDKYSWRTPLGSLLPKKICPKCGDSISGAYKFCPFDGTSLAK